MTSFKKKTKIHQIDALLKKFPLILLIQHHNLTVTDWFSLKEQLQQTHPVAESQFLNVKTHLLKQSTFTHEFLNHRSLETLCQGPNFLLGCETLEQVKTFWKMLKSTPKCLFISCFYKKQQWTHLDFQAFLTLTPSIYCTLVAQLDQKTALYQTLDQCLTLHPLNTLQRNLVAVLSQFTELKKQESTKY